MRLSYLVWFLFLAVVSWQDFQKQEISSWLLILMGALGTVIQLFEGSVSLGGWFGGIFLGLALLFWPLSPGRRSGTETAGWWWSWECLWVYGFPSWPFYWPSESQRW